ncbi:DEAD/DEAH box helicase [Aliarcobacter cibarius]|jgi:ATP-dependent RNA helicase RhlE|uniref:DEAD-box ATP-dependent RNA helicase RhpA n=1 Tax=Aliarcobacter cibarius TaxID=255507 RepID=A0A5J6RG49_9BACT|nr:DEAD/DEAH box helicase [Aliarcobacter cibarius]QEZ88884.1 DEAD-box ATP-dependent RNA helicase [Aliarcobacter cibarius]QKJ26925.1 DEAD-box ATP-dependent RNA helicase [Aliarcobacter cibarius]TLS97498.1 DEAD/DEAH box helicase [Aliarcobacter cibarius]TLS98009.1 DEAD/DEAH box helicase [Aliarcobacter cibarius]
MSFLNLGLCTEILRAVKEEGYTKATPIQIQSIPVILSKKDVLAAAQTGTGKTAGFTLPLLQLLNKNYSKDKKRVVKALILTPTRELASQVGQSVQTYGKYLSFKSAVIFGGVGINPQKAIIKKGIDIITATPGRLLDLVSQDSLDLSKVEFLVLDEADRMLDMGFIHDIKKILALLPKKRQNLLFSATFSPEIKKLADGLLNSPVLIEASKANSTSHKVEQTIHLVDKNRKKELLVHLLNKNNLKQVLVFTRTKHGANKLSEALIKDKITSAAIHGNKSQGARTKALDDFKSGKVRVLVATDIAARGIDIDQLPHVINFELPNVPEDYVHRIGRTGRAGNKGEAISLVCVDEHEYLFGIEKLIKQKINKIAIDGFKVDPNIKAESISNSKNKNNSQSRATKNKVSTSQDKTSNSKRDQENSSLSSKSRENNNRHFSKKSESSSNGSRNRRVNSTLKTK